MQIEAITPTPLRSFVRTVYTQRWEHLVFAHWAVPPEQVVPYMPPGVRPDVLDGVSYVGLIPFTMRRIGLGRSPGLPYLGSFLETNVRLYSVDERGRRGVVFVTLDASRLAPVLAARVTAGLPYVWSSMRRRLESDRISYTSRRRWPGPRGARSSLVVDIGGPIEPTEQEEFLTARWGLHLQDWSGSTHYWPNEHPQWSLRRASLVSLEDELLSAAGFGELATRPPDSLVYSPGVAVRFGPRSPVAETERPG